MFTLQKLTELYHEFDAALAQIIEQPGSPREVYEPISYILKIGGKRIRPAMAIAAFKLYQNETNTAIIQLAQAVEMFHNFTLLHDDIMDKSLLRRGKETVHIKWDESTAILCGDLLQIEVYEKLTSIGNLEILTLFNQMARELCEGQMNDMNFENRDQISNTDYLQMITQKTAVLLGFSMQSGALLGGASSEEAKKLYNLGIGIGVSFQLMDDYLDTFGEKAKVGKQIGGDILNQKKTFLWNEMWNHLDASDRDKITNMYAHFSDEEMIAHIKQKMIQTGADQKTLQLAQEHTINNTALLASINAPGDKTYLEEIMKMLSERES